MLRGQGLAREGVDGVPAQGFHLERAEHARLSTSLDDAQSADLGQVRSEGGTWLQSQPHWLSGSSRGIQQECGPVARAGHEIAVRGGCYPEAGC